MSLTPFSSSSASQSEAEDREALLRIYLGELLPYLGLPGLHGEPPVDGVAEIMINTPDDIWMEQYGKMQRLDLRITPPEKLENLTVRLAAMARNIGGEGAILTVYHWGLRIAATLPPTSMKGISLSIRRKVRIHVPLEEYAQSASPREELVIPAPRTRAELLQFLRTIVEQRKTILVSGGTSSGKTTFLNALLSCIPPHERLITIEDSPELEPTTDNCVRFITSESLGIDAKMLIKQCLRYRPDRIVVGEVRGAEALDMLDACNTGHDGSMTSIHANSPIEALERLETLVLRSGVPWPHFAIRQTVSQAIHYVIQMRLNAEGKRAISAIMEIQGMDPQSQTYRYQSIAIPEA